MLHRVNVVKDVIFIHVIKKFQKVNVTSSYNKFTPFFDVQCASEDLYGDSMYYDGWVTQKYTTLNFAQANILSGHKHTHTNTGHTYTQHTHIHTHTRIDSFIFMN